MSLSLRSFRRREFLIQRPSSKTFSLATLVMHSDPRKLCKCLLSNKLYSTSVLTKTVWQMVDVLVQSGLEDPRGLEREGGPFEMGERWRGDGVEGSPTSTGVET